MRATEQLQQTLGRQPIDEKIADVMAWPLKRVKGVKAVDEDLSKKADADWLGIARVEEKTER